LPDEKGNSSTPPDWDKHRVEYGTQEIREIPGDQWLVPDFLSSMFGLMTEDQIHQDFLDQIGPCAMCPDSGRLRY